MGFYSRLKHNVMVFCCLDTVFFFFFFFFLCGCYSILRLIICCEKRIKNAICGASVVFYSYCQCSSASCLSLTYC